MYLYLFDSFLAKTKYKKIIDKIETRITDLEISGRLVKLTILDSIPEIIKDALKRGIETVITVGNDKTFCQAASALVGSSASLGIIPVGENNKISEILGIPKEEAACEVISARLIDVIDVGMVNNHFFVSSIEIDTHKVVLKDDAWQIYPTSKINRVRAVNLDFYSNKVSSPQDALLEIILAKVSPKIFSFFGKKQGEIIDSLLFLKKIRIESPKIKNGLPVLVDGWQILKTPLEIEIFPQKIKVIVGRKRKF